MRRMKLIWFEIIFLLIFKVTQKCFSISNLLDIKIPQNEKEWMRRNMKTWIITRVSELSKEFKNDQKLYIQSKIFFQIW